MTSQVVPSPTQFQNPPSPVDALPETERASLAEAMTEARYAIEPSRIPGEDGAPHATNYRQDYRIRFDEKGPVLEARNKAAGWSVGLRAKAYGRMSAEFQVDGPGQRHTAGTRMEYRHGDFTEWYVNRPVGLEQGFTIATPPVTEGSGTAAQPLVVRMQVAGDLAPTLAADGKRVEFKDQHARKVLSYEKLVAFDAAGRTLPSHMEVAGTTLSLLVDDAGAQYPVTIDPVVISLLKRLTPPEGVTLGGDDVCIDGDTIVTTGAFTNGTVRILRRDEGGPGNWGYVKSLQELDVSLWGSAALSGNTLMFGGKEPSEIDGSDVPVVFVYERNYGGPDNWGRIKKLYDPDPDFPVLASNFGAILALDGDLAVIARWTQGEAYVYYRNAGGPNNWGLFKTLNGYFTSAAIDGDRIALLGDDVENPYIGVFVYERDEGGGDNWGRKKILYPETGPDMGIKSGYGGELDIDGDVIVVGDSDNRTAHIFEKDQGGTDNWGEAAQLYSDLDADSIVGYFGWAASVANGLVTIGGPYEKVSGYGFAGAAYVFAKNAGSWERVVKLTCPDVGTSGHFGIRVDAQDSLILVSSPGTPPYGGGYLYTDSPPVFQTWDGEGSTFSWHEGLNWTSDTEPTAADDVLFDDTSTKNCDTSNDVEVNDFFMDTGYTGSLTISNWQNFTAHGDVYLAGGTFNFGAFNYFEGNFTRTGGTINRRHMYFEGDGQYALRPGPRDVEYGALHVGGGPTLRVDILGDMDTTGLLVNDDAETRIFSTAAVTSNFPSQVLVNALGMLTVEAGGVLDARNAATFTNDGLFNEVGTGKILREATLLDVTDDSGGSTDLLVGAPFYVTLADDDENLDGQAIDTTTVEVFNLANGDAETLTLAETGAASATFRNTVAMPTQVRSSATAGNGILEAKGGDLIRIRYTDDEDTNDVLTLDIPSVGEYLPVVEALSVTPGATLNTPPAELLVTLNNDINAATVTADTVKLIGSGLDLSFGTPDDVTITPAGLIVENGNQIKLDLTGVTLPDDHYRLVLAGGASPLATGLSAYWNFEEGTGTQTADQTANGNTADLQGGVTWTPGGLFGTALDFDGVDGALKVTQDSTLEPATGITVSVWANVTSALASNVADLVRKETPFGAGFVLRWTGNDGKLQFWVGDSSSTFVNAKDTQPNSAYLNAWRNFTGTYDAATGTARLYIDGKLRSTAYGSINPLNHTDDFYMMFAAYGTQKALPGMLDEVRIYDRAVSDAEALGLAGHGFGITDLSGNVLDGEFDGTFPSGNGTEGGDFVSGFTVDRLPVAAADSATVGEGQSVNIDVAANDNDVIDALDLTSIQVVSGASHGSLQVNTDGTVDYTHDGSENFSDSFTYTIDDVTGATSNTATVSITITPVNDAPVANDDSGSVNEGQSVNIDVADNDTDADNALDLTSIQIVSGVAHGNLQVNDDGTVDYTHDGSENLTDSYTYTIDDTSGATSNIATVSITINPVNDKPVAGILGSAPFYIEENELLPFDGTGADAEDGTNVTYAWDWDDGSPDGSVQNPSHAWDEPGVYTVSLIVSDQDGLDSEPVTVQVIVTPKAGERDLFLKRGKFMVNWKAHNDGVDKDSLSVQGWLNPAGCSANLSGATFEVSVNGVLLGAVPLASNGKGSTATAKASLKAKTGVFSYSIKDADLRTAIGLANVTEAGDVELAVEINVQNAGLYTDTFTAHAHFAYTTTQDVFSKGNFNFKTAESADGYFFAAKTVVAEDKTGKHKVSVKGYFDAPGGADVTPAGDVTLTIGTQTIAIPEGSFTDVGGVISLPNGAHPDLAKFALDTNKEMFTILTNALPGTGVPPAGNPATAHDLLVRIEIPTAGDPVVFETTVEILRSSPTSKKWNR